MTFVKAEYLVTQDSESGEEQNVKFVPPVPSDGDLGGISKEDSEQITKNKNDIDDIRMTLWDKILDKLTSAVVERLNTTNKTVIGALNELNSNRRTPVIVVSADDEKELCRKIADVIISNPNFSTLVISWKDRFSVGVTVYYTSSTYFIYTVHIFDTSNRYICEYFQGNISIK